MQNIELEALKCYEQNLNYIAQSNTATFRKLQAFEVAETNHAHKAHYDLEYKDSYFDVKHLQTGNYLYDTDSIKYSKKIAQNINFKKDSYIFSAIRDYHISDDVIENLASRPSFEGSNIKDVLPIMHYANKIAPTNTTMEKIDKFIFIGVGLGIHIPLIDDKIHSSEYLIIEDDLELFRLSMFTTPYYELGKNANLFLSVSESTNEFTATMSRFLEGSFFNNRYLKYHHFSAHSDTKITLIQNNLASQTHLTFPYDVQLEKYLRPLLRMKKEYKTLCLSKKLPESIISQKPVLVLGAGPSMKKNIQWIKENQDKFIIICVSAALKTLHSNNIVPDIVTHIDGVVAEGNSCMVHFEGLDISTYLKDSIFILGPHVPDSFLELLSEDQIYFFESFTYYNRNSGSLSAPCVGSLSLILSLQINAKEIYTLGLNLALDPETGETHSSDHEYNAKHDMDEFDKVKDTISLTENVLNIKGNLRPNVYVTPILYSSVVSLLSQIPKHIDNTQTIYNLSDGAFLDSTTPKQIDEVQTVSMDSVSKNELSTKLHKFFNSHSERTIDDEDKESLKRRLEIAKEILNDFQIYGQKKFTNTNTYLYDMLGVVSSTLKYQGRESNNLILVLASYFQYTTPYILDVAYTKEVTKTMKHLEKIDAFFIDGALNILNKYIKDIEAFFTKD